MYSFGPHLLKQNSRRWNRDSPVHPRMKQQGRGTARCSEKARSLRCNLVPRDHVCLPQEAAIPACNSRFKVPVSHPLAILSFLSAGAAGASQGCASEELLLSEQFQHRKGEGAWWGRWALCRTQLSTVNPPDTQWAVKACTRTFLPKPPNCLNNFYSVNKEQECSSKTRDEFATGGFLC